MEFCGINLRNGASYALDNCRTLKGNLIVIGLIVILCFSVFLVVIFSYDVLFGLLP